MCTAEFSGERRNKSRPVPLATIGARSWISLGFDQRSSAALAFNRLVELTNVMCWLVVFFFFLCLSRNVVNVRFRTSQTVPDSVLPVLAALSCSVSFLSVVMFYRLFFFFLFHDCTNASEPQLRVSVSISLTQRSFIALEFCKY